MAVPQNYYENDRPELVELIDQGDNIVLDVGCGAGAMASAIKEQGRAVEVWGVEVVPEIAEKARERGIFDRILCGDVQQLVDELPLDHFTHIVAGDVLEHLIDPWTTVEKLHQRLTDNGRFISGIPNIRTIPFIVKLLTSGSFEYKDSGVMDRTHLRFFARKDIDKMLSDAGFTNIKIGPVPKKRHPLKRFGRALFGDLVIRRLLVTASK